MSASPSVFVSVDESRMTGVRGESVPAAAMAVDDVGSNRLWFLRVPLACAREIGEALVAFSNERASIAI